MRVNKPAADKVIFTEILFTHTKVDTDVSHKKYFM